ncbi:MAG: ABC transporter substrate-binding protein [Candidimonas sp.]|nr:MAG: ABC transporter substrate-binding protein [Candidimonas sp.]
MSHCGDECGEGGSPFVGTTRGISRRAVLKRIGGVMGGAAAIAALPAYALAANEPVKLAFCSQLLCVVPYEVTRAAGFFAEQGLDVQLVYSRGGSAALQALNSGGVDYAATSFDAALNAFSHKAGIVRFAETGRLPLFALATSPRMAGKITAITDLKGKILGVAQLGNADHALAIYLLKRNGVDPETVQFATLGPNLYQALRLGQVDAGMVQEPGLTLLGKEGARTLVNLMDLADAKRYLGGPYAFMGVAVRSGEVGARLAQMRRLGQALAAGLKYMKEAPIGDVIKALPDILVAGGNIDVLAQALDKHRQSLYPSRVQIDRSACERVMRIQVDAGVQSKPVDLNVLLDQAVLGT